MRNSHQILIVDVKFSAPTGGVHLIDEEFTS